MIHWLCDNWFLLVVLGIGPAAAATAYLSIVAEDHIQRSKNQPDPEEVKVKWGSGN